MTEIIDVSEWVPSDEPEWMGTRSKVWLQDPTSNEVLWLFKAIRSKEQHDGTVRCFGEDWAEWLAVQAADHLQVPAAEVRLASWQGHAGVITRSMLRHPDGGRVADRLEHGNELLQAVDPAYDAEQQREAVGYTLPAVWTALEGCGVPQACQPPLTVATDVFAGIIVLDALIANTDRHHENWELSRWVRNTGSRPPSTWARALASRNRTRSVSAFSRAALVMEWTCGYGAGGRATSRTSRN